MNTTTTDKNVLLSRFVTVDGVEYHVELGIWPGSENYSLDVTRQPEPPGMIWPRVFSAQHSIEDGIDAFEGLRYALRQSRSDMCRCLRSWQELRLMAAAEPAGNVKGSKRSYYTKQANYWLKRALEHEAPKWRLAKQLWKELTRL